MHGANRIESGIIYSLYIILDLAFRKHPVGSVVLDAGLIQIVVSQTCVCIFRAAVHHLSMAIYNFLQGIMPTLIIVQVGLGRAVHDIEANESIARLGGHKNRPIAMQVDAGIPGGGTMNIHCVHPRQYRHTAHAHINVHPTVVAEGVTSNSTGAIIAKRSDPNYINALDRTDTHDQCLANEMATRTVLDGEIAGVGLGSLCGPTLRMDRAVSLRLSWGEEMGLSASSGLGILQQIPKTV
jgi:hypothetical protein